MVDTLDSFTGFVDRATLVEQPAGIYFLYLRGWILVPKAPVSALFFSLANNTERRAHQEDRTDVADMSPLVPHARGSGFNVTLPVQVPLQEYRVALRASLVGGGEINSTIQVQPTPSPAPAVLAQTLLSPAHHTTNGPHQNKCEERRKLLVEASKMRLEAFMALDHSLTFKSPKAPVVSIVIPVAGQSHLTLGCLETIQTHTSSKLEILVVDSSDDSRTQELLAKTTGITSIRMPGNRNFSRACNAGAKKARGTFLLFLNNDTILLPGAIDSALRCHRTHKHCGAVGAKLVRPDGLIQEVGSFILPNGGTVGRGRGTDTAYPSFNETIAVDYCSAAFLLTKRSIFDEVGGFDERFDPAYYEDVDYCIRLAKAGYQVFVAPTAEVLHLERGTSEKMYDVDNLMARNRGIFQEIHPEYIPQSGITPASPLQPGVKTNTRDKHEETILVIDDRVPHPHEGQGQGRALLLLNTLLEMGFKVAWYPAHGVRSTDAPPKMSNVSVVCPKPKEPSLEFLRRVMPQFPTVLVSRSHHMEQVQLALRSMPQKNCAPRVIYDAEAVQAKREILRFQLQRDRQLTDSEIEAIVCNEVIVARDADAIIASSQDEASIFCDFGFKSPFILSHGIRPSPSKAPFEQRTHLLTIGPMLSTDTPNSDGVEWFMDEVMPHIVSRLRTSKISLHVAGDCRVPALSAREGLQLILLGRLADLSLAYERYRVFVAPTRFSAGIPLKVIEAAAHGVPAVVTPLIAHQLGWSHGNEVLVGSSPSDFAEQCANLYSKKELWERIRSNAVERVRNQFSMEQFQRQVSSIVTGA
jgi:GT2 family glycosyltransferase